MTAFVRVSGVLVGMANVFLVSLVGEGELGNALMWNLDPWWPHNALYALCAAAAGLVEAPLPDPLLRTGSGAVALVFAARAIGDFRYVGFSKRVRGSPFARRDTYVYSPLCLLLAALIGVVALA